MSKRLLALLDSGEAVVRIRGRRGGVGGGVVLTDLRKTPPWFGGKADAALPWEALGDVDRYVESFAGSHAVLLDVPHEANRTYHSETVNDLDGLLLQRLALDAGEPRGHRRRSIMAGMQADVHATPALPALA